jgi:phosphoglycolate phosphatase-like HAD superfamily hydrolase
LFPDDVRRTLAELKQAGYIMAVLSNRDKPFVDVLESHRILEFFDFAGQAAR